MTEGKWVMNRAGLLNFWYYDDEIFEFADGKLLLRGTNGSGKSVTMQSILPVLLDGKKTPDRLDPFGSKARKMEDYLLGEKEVSGHDERTGYLFLEYQKQGTKQYITTGIGMQAKRHKTLKSWYFVLTDNRRIGYDFELAHTRQSERIPLSAKELENRIGSGGYLVHSQKEYMELVNKYIFGFQSMEAFEDLIKLLIQLRSPKLSKDFKPTVIYEILESALPPLTDDELRHLSDTIESMDETEQQLEQLEREHESAKKLVRQYDLYNQYILAERAQKWREAESRLQDAKQDASTLETRSESLRGVIENLEEEKKHYEQKRDVLKAEQERLQHHEVWRLEKEKGEKQARAEKLKSEVADLEKKWEAKKSQLLDIRLEQDRLETENSKDESSMQETLDELALDAGDAAFTGHGINAGDFSRHEGEAFDFSVWKRETKQHSGLLQKLRQLAGEAERLHEAHLKLQRQSSAKKQEIDELRKQLDHLENWFTEQKQELEDAVFLWIEQHPALSFTDERLRRIAGALDGLYEENRYEAVREEIVDAANDYILQVRTEISRAEQEQKAKEQELAEAEETLVYWQNLKLANPERPADTEAFRARLHESGKRYLPFYAAVEFQDHVVDAQKARIEAALRQTGILDSLITEEPVTPVHDRVIRPNPHILGYTLADYLKPDPGDDSPVSAARIDEVLRSIPLEPSDSGFHIDADGSFSIGCLVGHAPDEGPSKFIGRTSRKRYQQEKIKETEQKIAEIRLALLQMESRLSDWAGKVQEAEDWKAGIPDDKDLRDIEEQMEKTARSLKQEQEFLSDIDREWKQVYQDLQNIRLQLHEQGAGLNLVLQSGPLDEALAAAKSYEEHLHSLELIFQRLFSGRKMLARLAADILEKEQELDEIRGEENIRRSEWEKTVANIEAIEQQLKLQGIDEVRARIQAVQHEYTSTEEKIREIYEEKPKKEAELEKCTTNLSLAKTRTTFWTNMAAEWEKLVKAELSLGFVESEHTEPESILTAFSGVLEKYDRAKLNENLTKVFFNEQSNLTEYRMSEFTKEADPPDWFAEKLDDYYETFKKEWEGLRGRRLIQMEYRGRRVSPYTVLESLEKELLNLQSYLDEQDRRLYEDIIVNTVGVILRNRIQRAAKWVKEMDAIMRNRDNSSGLTFSIAWKEKTAESEDELDTKDLVALLQRNSKFLNEDDLNRITKHFRSRIAAAKELIEIRNEGSTLHQVLKEVLDYRKWFQFVLSYKRAGEPKRELSNTAFFKFSGGEKAMAMYIPLFTAAYSRYLEAGSMAPYIISLDEAFAGVDENNIRDMFEVVEQLGFNYIMNSQALWGDYDTISSLAICELVRPKNANFVTVIRYRWDGHKRSIVEKPEEALAGAPDRL
ncbi:TIGR02680 family protein [Heyndrickxia faecalis]|uniref:TIGR02680 family protein n=1 Tax=Heyndrickxia TaxID=2837504 RepID=UPI002E1FF4F3|nr:TIGR02680 family protein [Weizmannia sp. CD-2023]